MLPWGYVIIYAIMDFSRRSLDRKEVWQLTEKLEQYKERISTLQQQGGLTEETESLLADMLLELAELNRSNKALRRVILKTGQDTAMSTRLRDALYE